MLTSSDTTNNNHTGILSSHPCFPPRNNHATAWKNWMKRRGKKKKRYTRRVDGLISRAIKSGYPKRLGTRVAALPKGNCCAGAHSEVCHRLSTGSRFSLRLLLFFFLFLLEALQSTRGSNPYSSHFSISPSPQWQQQQQHLKSLTGPRYILPFSRDILSFLHPSPLVHFTL